MNNRKDVIEKALSLLLNSEKSGYQIWKDTGITEPTIGNYKSGKTKPTEANANILVKYFEQSILSDTTLVEGKKTITAEEEKTILIQSIGRMTETADRNSRTLEKIVNYLICSGVPLQSIN